MKLNLLFICLLLGLLPGCMVGPDYVRPRVCVPAAYEQGPSAQERLDLTQWWSVFDDVCLSDLIERAICSNYDLRIAVERIEEVASLYRIERARLFPEVDGVIETNRHHFSQNLAQFEFLSPDQRTLDFLRFGFEVLWEIDLWGRIRRAKRAAFAEYQAQIEDARGVYIMLVSDVASAYINLRTLEKSIQLRKERIALDTTLLDLQKERFSSGIDSNILVQQTIAELEESRTLLANLTSVYVQTKNALALLLGQLPEGFVVCKEPYGEPRVPHAPIDLHAGLPSDLIRRRPDIRRSERVLAAATERVGEAVADLFPRFNLLATVTTEASKPAGWFATGSLNWFIGSAGRWPFLNFGRIQYNIEAKKSIQRQALLVYCQSVVAAFKDVEDALVAYFTSKDRVKFLTTKLQAVTHERDLVKDRYTAGLVDQSQYVLAEKTRVEIEEQLTDAQRAESLALVAVYKALGGGWTECEEPDVSHCP